MSGTKEQGVHRTSHLAYVITPDGQIRQVGSTQIEWLATLVDQGPIPSMTAWVVSHLGRDHGYRREDAWRYVRSGFAVVDDAARTYQSRPVRGGGQRVHNHGRVSAPLHTRALVAWYRKRWDDPDLEAALREGWSFRPGDQLAASGHVPLGDGPDVPGR